MARTSTGGTRVDAVQARIRGDILSGRIQPGDRLKFPVLCAQLEVSAGVVREALSRLVDQGLVRMQPHQGFAVTPLSHHDLRELTSARIAIETMTFRASVLHGSLDWETAAVAAHHRLARTPLHDPSDSVGLSESWADAHNQFHQALLAGCPNRRLLDIALRMREEAELYRRWSVVFGDEPERDIEGEHRLLVEAATARDADLAVERLSAHIAHTAELLITCAVDDHADAAPMVELGITP